MNINGVVMKKLIIYIISSFVILSTSFGSDNLFIKLPNAIDKVLFTYNKSNSSIYLRSNGFSLVAKQPIDFYNFDLNSSPLTTYKIHRVDFDFIGANDAQIISDNNHTNDYTTISGLTHKLLNTNEVIYKNIYDGIDFRAYFNNEGDFEFDFIVNVGANPDDIRLLQKYNKYSRVTGEKELEIGIEFGSIALNAPFTYQEKLENSKAIESSYKLESDTLSFSIGEYDKTKVLIIDPIARIMGSYFGSQGNEICNDIEEDASGNYYITGYTESPTNIAVGGYQLIHGGLLDAYIAKFDKNNKRLWSTYFGGMALENGNGISIDNQGNIILVGETSSQTNIATPNAHQPIYGGSTSDGFIAKFLSNGQLLWATYYGGQEVDKINGVITDTDGNIYVVGQSSSDDNIYFNGNQHIRGGMNDAFIAKFNPLGARIWGTYYGGGADDIGYGITLDTDDNVFIVGSTESDNQIALQGNVPNRQGQIDAFVSSFDTDGFIRWGTYYGGSNNDVGTTISSDGYYVYFGGRTQSHNGIYLNGHQNNLGGGWDGFLVKYDTFQNPFWGTYYGGSGDDFINSIAVKGINIFTSGSTSSSSNINLLGWQQNFGGGISDGTIAKYITAGQMEWSTYYGGSGRDELKSISSKNKLFIAGLTNSSNNIGSNGFQNSHAGVLDAMFGEMTEAELKLLISDNKFCSKKEYVFSVDYFNMNFAPDNEFIIEMSDELGKFDAPVIVGRKTSSSKVDILIKIPDFLDYSRKYRFRLRSTNPVFEGVTNVDSVTIYPSPRIINSSDPVCVNTIRVFSAQSIPDVTYKWSFEDGILVNASDIVNNVRWENAGTYKVQLIAENPVCTDTSIKSVVVKNIPEVKLVGNTSVCGFTSEIYTINKNQDYTYTWNAVEGKVIDIDDNGTAKIEWNNVNKIGQVIVVATDTSSGCISTEMLEIELKVAPEATITGTDSTCRGCVESVFTPTTGKAKWLVDGGNIENEYEFQLDYRANENADSVIVTLIKTNENNGCSDTTNKVIYLNDAPVTSISGLKTVCENQKYTYSTNQNPELLNTWSITGGIKSDETQNTIDVIWGNSGNGKIKLIQQTKDLLYKDSAELNITINKVPTELSHNLPSSICTGDTLYVDFNLKTGEKASLLIDGIIYTDKYVVTEKQDFTVSAIVTNSSNCSYSENIQMIVLPTPPKAVLFVTDKVIYSGKEGIHRWYLDGVLLTGQTDNYIANPTEGVYTSQYKNSTCWSELSEEFVYSTSSVEEFNNFGISIYPNPAKNYLKVNSRFPIKSLSIIDIIGRRLYIKTDITNEELNISGLKAGIYFVKILVNDKLLTKKLIVE